MGIPAAPVAEDLLPDKEAVSDGAVKILPGHKLIHHGPTPRRVLPACDLHVRPRLLYAVHTSQSAPAVHTPPALLGAVQLRKTVQRGGSKGRLRLALVPERKASGVRIVFRLGGLLRKRQQCAGPLHAAGRENAALLDQSDHVGISVLDVVADGHAQRERHTSVITRSRRLAQRYLIPAHSPPPRATVYSGCSARVGRLGKNSSRYQLGRGTHQNYIMDGREWDAAGGSRADQVRPAWSQK